MRSVKRLRSLGSLLVQESHSLCHPRVGAGEMVKRAKEQQARQNKE